MNIHKNATLGAALAICLIQPAIGQSTIRSAPASDYLIGGYVAHISSNDLFNSNGSALTEPWQVLRQDRANFHRFGIRDTLDTGDDFFGRADNRATMESMLARGSISAQAARDIMSGHAVVLVEIYGAGNVGRSVHVTVAR